MLIHIGYELIYDIPAPVEMALMLYVHPERTHVLRQPEWLTVEPRVPVRTYIDSFGNRVGRILAPAGQLRLYYDNVALDSGFHEPKIDGTVIHPVDELPDACLQFLMPSRYVESDQMSQMAWDLFGNVPADWRRVQAVMDWVFANVTFGYEFARSTKTALQMCDERRGVCRDFMHTAVALLRALNVPARYATGYLGDIGVPIAPFPMDFCAWFEVYLSGRWYTLDARHNEPRIGRVLQARGRDAADVALTTTFGPSFLRKFQVWTEEIK